MTSTLDRLKNNFPDQSTKVLDTNQEDENKEDENKEDKE